MNRITKSLLFTFGGIALLLVILYGAAEYTSRPNFCSSCHYMEPYVEAWRASSHSDVTCTDCHFEPGIRSKIHGKLTAASMVVNYFTGVYKKSKPWAEIDDASCLRSGCHVEQQLNEDVIFKEGIHFNHGSHLNNLRRNKKLRCTSCHSQIVQGEHMTVTETSCFLCHFKNHPEEKSISDCTWCHSAPVANSDSIPLYDHKFVMDENIDCTSCHGNMVVGDGAVLESRCNICHADIGKIKKINDAEFMHQMHVTDHKVECENCHIPIQHKSIAHTKDIFPECQECHLTPHKAQFDLFSGTGGKQIQDHPNPMFTAGLNCKACHIYHKSEFGISEKTFATGESCEKCHGEGYAKLYQHWEDNMKEKASLVKLGLDFVYDAIAKKAISDSSINNSNLLKDAEYNYQLVKTGNVVHNVAYSDELLLSAYKNIKKMLALAESDVTLPSLELYNSVSPSKCQNCHYGQEAAKVEAFGIEFDHSKHMQKDTLDCLTCHSHQSVHGETTITRETCLSCHHSQDEVDCAKCHQTQANFYDGSIDISDEQIADYMYDDDVECIDCHKDDDDVILKETGRNCSNCHDEEYDEMIIEWQDQTTTKIVAIKESLAKIVYDDLDKSNRQKIDIVREGIEKIESDKSLGVHNIELITNLLNQYQNTVGSIIK